MKERFESPKVNPAQSSFLEENLELEEQGTVDTPSIYNGASKKRLVFREKNTGEEFFIVSTRPEFQRFISYTIKGIINSSDVIKQGTNYFSHKQKLENVPSGDDSYLEEIKADTFILKYIFGDYDHQYYQSEDSRRTDFLKSRDISENVLHQTDTEHRNIVINQEKKNMYYFDFDQAGSPGLGAGEGIHSLQLGTKFDKEGFKNLLHEKLYNETFAESTDTQHPLSRTKTLKILKHKVSSLIRDIFSPEQFSRFKAIVERSGTKFKERGFDFYEFKADDQNERVQELFEDLSERCRLMNEVVNEEFGKVFYSG